MLNDTSLVVKTSKSRRPWNEWWFGRKQAGTLRLAAEGGVHRWSTKFGRLSPRSTTRWGELPVARALDDENEGRRGVLGDLLS